LTINEVFPGSIGTDQTVPYNEVPGLIRSENAGSGTGGITYRWAMSENGSSWLPLQGANGETYWPGALTVTTYYRRTTIATMAGGTVCESEPATPVIITVMHDAPIANDDFATTPIGAPVTITVLDNDTLSGGALDPSTVRLIEPGTGKEITEMSVAGEGTYVVDPNTGTITSTPESGFTGETAPVGYIVRDESGTESNPAILTIMVTGIPVAEGVVVHNVISPNGDGVNDYLIISGIEPYPDNMLEIYNQWGVRVFKAQGYNNSGRVFDGTDRKSTRL